MARVVELNAFRQEPLAATLPPARQRGTATFCLHARTKSMLAFACALRWLISPFHKAKKKPRRDLRAATLGTGETLSIPHPTCLSISIFYYSRIASVVNF